MLDLDALWELTSHVDATTRTARVMPSGELDLATASSLDEALRAAERQCSRVTLDLRDLRFMDCTGLALIAAAADRARRRGNRFVVVRASPMVARLFALTAFERRLALLR